MKKFNNILCVLSATHDADEVLTHAVHIAKKNNATLAVLLALDSLPPTANMVMQSASYLECRQTIERHAVDWLEDKVSQWSKDYPMTARVTMGSPVDNIDAFSRELNADLVIRHTEEGIIGAIAGTDDVHLIHKVDCPVLVTHHRLPKDYEHVLIAVDANYHYEADEVAEREALNTILIKQGMQIAQMENARCTIVSIYDLYPSALLGDGFISIPVEDVLQDESKEIKTEQYQIIEGLVAKTASELQPTITVEQGNARTQLPDIAAKVGADLVVMGTVARVGIPGLLMGNTVASVITQLECAVLALKPETE